MLEICCCSVHFINYNVISSYLPFSFFRFSMTTLLQLGVCHIDSKYVYFIPGQLTYGTSGGPSCCHRNKEPVKYKTATALCLVSWFSDRPVPFCFNLLVSAFFFSYSKISVLANITWTLFISQQEDSWMLTDITHARYLYPYRKTLKNNVNISRGIFSFNFSSKVFWKH